jgi:coproporphyrinogen dehydrogenase HemZ
MKINISIKLNDLSYRYDVYQIFNIFFAFFNIEFDSEKYDFVISIFEEYICIQYKDIEEEYLYEDGLSKREGVKKSVFKFLSKLTEKVVPWGTMVGIRPSKIALDLLQKGYSEKEIIQYYQNTYGTSEEKARLCTVVAKAERKIVNKDKNTVSIYIGMPFCPTRCSYCSFASNPINACKGIVEPYLEALNFEIKAVSNYIKNKGLTVECIYFGGGTPTSVSDSEFKYILESISRAFNSNNKVKEFTVECGRPDSISRDKLITMKENNVHRISINPQTMNDNTLKQIGRNHSVSDVVDTFHMARSLGFDNINMDIIVGLPKEGIVEMENTCREILKLKPESITVHCMAVKRASKLYEDSLDENIFSDVESDKLNRMFSMTGELADMLGMNPYYMYRQKNMVAGLENLGYALKGRECIYNIQMIEEVQTIIALGADAVSKVIFSGEGRIERFANVKDVREYINRYDEMINKKINLLNTLYID